MDGPDVRWDGIAHGTIVRMVKTGPGAKLTQVMEDRLRSIAEALDYAGNLMGTAMRKSGVVWLGEAADAATRATQVLRGFSDGMHFTSNVAGIRVFGQSDAAEFARANVPPVVDFGPPAPVGSPADVLGATVDHDRKLAAARQAELRAREIMQQYTAATVERAAAMPRLSQAPAVVLEFADPGVRPDRGPGPGGGPAAVAPRGAGGPPPGNPGGTSPGNPGGTPPGTTGGSPSSTAGGSPDARDGVGAASPATAPAGLAGKEPEVGAGDRPGGRVSGPQTDAAPPGVPVAGGRPAAGRGLPGAGPDGSGEPGRPGGSGGRAGTPGRGPVGDRLGAEPPLPGRGPGGGRLGAVEPGPGESPGRGGHGGPEAAGGRSMSRVSGGPSVSDVDGGAGRGAGIRGTGDGMPVGVAPGGGPREAPERRGRFALPTAEHFDVDDEDPLPDPHRVGWYVAPDVLGANGAGEADD